ncbi:hypothetical protein TNCV_4379971 [Trichonephila clavipes]|nr:hypothetical protein TNCV_4379971 [Trichonephila clavipes]
MIQDGAPGNFRAPVHDWQNMTDVGFQFYGCHEIQMPDFETFYFSNGSISRSGVSRRSECAQMDLVARLHAACTSENTRCYSLCTHSFRDTLKPASSGQFELLHL